MPDLSSPKQLVPKDRPDLPEFGLGGAAASVKQGVAVANIGAQIAAEAPIAAFTSDEQDRMEIYAATLGAYDPYRWDLLSPKGRNQARRVGAAIVRMERENPEVRALFESSPGAAAAATSLQWIMPSLSRYFGDDLGREALLAAADVVADMDPFVSPEKLLADAEAEAKWYRDWTDGSAFAELVEAGVAQEDITGSDSPIEGSRLFRLTALLDRPVEGRLFQNGRRLVLTTSDDEGNPLNTIDLLLDEGTAIDRPADMLAALVEAWAGKRHRILSQPDEIAGNQTALGAAAESIGSLVNAAGTKVEEWNQPWNWLVANAQETVDTITGGGSFQTQTAESTAEMKRRQVEQQGRQVVADYNNQVVSEEALLMAAAQRLRFQNPELSLVGSTEMAYAALGDPATRDEFRQIVQLSEVEAEQVIADIKEAADPESGLKAVVGDALGLFTSLAGAYGWLLDQTAVHLVDMTRDFGEGLVGLVGLGDGPAGFQAFKNTWDWTEANRLSEYWGIEGQDGLWLDIGANFFIDPFLWLAPSGAARTSAWQDNIAVAGRTRGFMELPTVQRQVSILRKGRELGDDMLIEATLAGAPSRMRESIYRALDGTDAEVVAALEAQLPANGGLWIPDPFGRMKLRNGATSLEDLARAARNSDEAAGLLVESVGSFSRGTAVNLSEFVAADAIIDTLIQWYPADKIGFSAALRKVRAVEKAWWEGETIQRAAGVVADTTAKDALRAARTGLWKEARAKLPKNVNVRGLKGTAEEKLKALLDNATAYGDEATALRKEADYLDGVIGTGIADDQVLARRATVGDRLVELDGTGKQVDELLRRQRQLKDQHPFKAGEANGGRPADVAAELDAIKGQLDDLAKTPGGRGLVAGGMVYEDLLRVHREFLESSRKLLDDVETAKVAAARAAQGGGTMRQAFERLMAELEDDYGSKVLGLTRKTSGPKNPLLGKRDLDWSPVTGESRFQGESVGRALPLAEDAAGQAEIIEAGLMAQPFNYYMRVSPQAALSYKMLKDGGRWERFLGRANRTMADAARTASAPGDMLRAMRPVKDFAQRAYFLGVLTRPLTALKSYLDEAMRFAQVGGLRRTVSPVRSSFGDASRTLRAGERSRLAAKQIDQGYGFSRRVSEWKVAARKKSGATAEILNDKAHREAAFEWLGGQLLPDPSMAALSQSARATAEARGISVLEVLTDVPAAEWVQDAFIDWWAGGGRARARGAFQPRKGAPTLENMDRAMQRVANGVAFLAKSSDAPAEVASRLVDMAADGIRLEQKIDAHQQLIRQLGPMPSRRWAKADAGKADMLMNVLYGAPGRQRYGLFHSRFQEMVYEVFDRAAPGRMLTPEFLVEQKLAASIQDAELLMIRNQELASRIAHQHGLYTERMIDAVADMFARRNADHLIYRPGARSALGTRIAKHVPFGPAQYDWLGFYTAEATKSAAVGLFGKGVKEVSLGGKPLPLNLHLMARAGEYGAMFDKVADANGDEEWFLPTDVFDEFTFFPRLDSADHFGIDMGIGFGPVDSWVLAMASTMVDRIDPENDEWWAKFLRGADDFLTTVSPAIDFQNDPLRWDALLDNYIINNPGSALNLLGSLKEWAETQGWDASGFESSPYIRDATDSVVMDVVAGWAGQPIAGIEPEAVLSQAADMIGGRTVAESLVRMLPLGGLLGQPDLTTDNWGGFVADLPGLVGAGLLGQNQADDLADLWAKHESGTLSEKERKEFHGQIRTVLFGLRDFPNGEFVRAAMIVRHPELAWPMVSRWRPVVDPRTGEPLDPDAEEVLDSLGTSPESYERFLDGIGRFYEERPLTETLAEVKWRVASARRTVMREKYLPLLNRLRAMAGEDPTETFRPGSDQNADWVEGFILSFTEKEIGLWQSLGVTVDKTMDFQAFAAAVADANSALTEFSYPEVDSIRAEQVRYDIQNDPRGRELMEVFDTVADEMEARGYDDPADYPIEVLRNIQDRWGELIQGRELLTIDDYNLIYANRWGPYEWEPLVPGALDSLPEEETAAVYAFEPSDVFVVDGDTLDVLTESGPLRFRLIGVNAPDAPMPGYEESYLDLYALLKEEGHELNLVVWRADFFGTTAGTNFSTGEDRLKAWLFVDGQPVYHSDVFTFRNPTGRGSGTTYKPLPRPSVTVPEGTQ